MKLALKVKKGFGWAAVGWAAATPAFRLFGVASERAAGAPIRVFVCAAASSFDSIYHKLSREKEAARISKGKGAIVMWPMRSIFSIRLGFVLLLPLAVLLQGCEKAAGPTPITTKDIRHSYEQAPLVELAAPPTVGGSGDDLHIAWPQLTQNGTLVVVIDGQAGPEDYDDVGLIVFSPDGKRIAYPAKRGSKWVMVVDGQAGPEYDDIRLGYTVFSPDSKRLVYGAMQGDKWFVVLDGEPGPESGYDNVGYFIFSPDSSRLVYAVGKGNRQYMVVDGRDGEVYERVGEPVFSPDGKHLAYLAAIKYTEFDKERQFVVLDGRESKRYDGVNRPIFSEDGRHIAYSIMKGPKHIVIVDGKEGPEYEGINMYSVVLSPDGESFAYAANKGGKWFVVWNGREGPEYDGIALGSPVFSPDGEDLLYAATKDGKWFLVLDGEPIEYDYDDIGDTFLFSPDGRHFVYAALKDDKWFLVVDGQNGPPYEYVSKPAFKADGIEYLAERNDGWLLRCRQSFMQSGDAGETVEEKISRLPEP